MSEQSKSNLWNQESMVGRAIAIIGYLIIGVGVLAWLILLSTPFAGVSFILLLSTFISGVFVLGLSEIINVLSSIRAEVSVLSNFDSGSKDDIEAELPKL